MRLATVNIQRDHPLVSDAISQTLEGAVLKLMQRKAYEEACILAVGKSVLDWGCNDGYGLQIMRKVARDIAGLDSAVHCIAAAHNRIPDLRDRIRFYDGVTVPFLSCRFDVITSFQVIEHVQNYDEYFRHISSVLDSRGILIITTPNRTLRLDPKMKPWNPFHVTEFSGAQLKALLERFFEEVQVFGLQAEKEIAAIERARCERAKRLARYQRRFSQRLRKALVGTTRRLAKKLLSTSGLVNFLPKFDRREVAEAPATAAFATPVTVTELSIKQFCYSSDPNQLDEALDLLAVCRNFRGSSQSE
jgi:2-polyprenyl-3-methyl-5-hydroxy-6-metoxy-1,4-benzoquinol methylase